MSQNSSSVSKYGAGIKPWLPIIVITTWDMSTPERLSGGSFNRIACDDAARVRNSWRHFNRCFVYNMVIICARQNRLEVNGFQQTVWEKHPRDQYVPKTLLRSSSRIVFQPEFGYKKIYRCLLGDSKFVEAHRQRKVPPNWMEYWVSDRHLWIAYTRLNTGQIFIFSIAYRLPHITVSSFPMWNWNTFLDSLVNSPIGLIGLLLGMQGFTGDSIYNYDDVSLSLMKVIWPASWNAATMWFFPIKKPIVDFQGIILRLKRTHAMTTLENHIFPPG